MKKVIVFFVIVFFISVPNVSGEPSKTIQYLMNEPVSMFDWGIYKLEKYFSNRIDIYSKNKKNIDIAFYSAEVEYEWENNRIVLFSMIDYKGKKLSIDKEKAYCKEFINYIKNILYASKKEKWRKSLGISSYFTHNTFSKSNKPSQFVNNIENITKIIVYVKHVDEIHANYIKSKSKLLENSIYYRDDWIKKYE